jgi:hypothetical protein
MLREEIVRILERNGLKLSELSHELRNDKDLALIAIKSNPFSFQFVGELLIDDYGLIKFAYKYKKFSLNYNNPGGLELIEYCPIEIRHNVNFLLELLEFDFSIWKYFPEHYLNEEYFMKQAVSFNSQIITRAGEHLKNNREIVLIAAKNNGYFLNSTEFEHFVFDREIILEGCISNSSLINEKLPAVYKNDFLFIKELFERSRVYPISYTDVFPTELLFNKELVVCGLPENFELLMRVINERDYLYDEEFILNVFRRFPNHHKYLKVITKLIFLNLKKDDHDIKTANYIKHIRNLITNIHPTIEEIIEGKI